MLDVNPFLEMPDPEPWGADDTEREPWSSDGRPAGGSRVAGDTGDADVLNRIADQPSLADHLHVQLSVLPLDERDLALARAVVESLDDDGHLRTGLDEIAACTGLQPQACWAEMRIALRRVQSLDPTGVGARSLQECLMLQTRDIDCDKTRQLARQIIDAHLLALATSRDGAPLALTLGQSPADVQRAFDRIRRMDPHPGWRLGTDPVRYITPDVLVRKVRGGWTTALNPAVVPRVRFNQVYADLFERHRRRQDNALADHLRDARWAMRSVQQRFATILQVARSIVDRQVAFLEYGEMALKPMTLRDIADEVGIHESTVSRVTNNKYLATPSGVYELKYFFSRAIVSSNGSACSGTAIRGLIKDIIEAERAENPFSDAEITRQLARQGLVVARRTVTKYRQMLRIDAVERRRQHS